MKAFICILYCAWTPDKTIIVLRHNTEGTFIKISKYQTMYVPMIYSPKHQTPFVRHTFLLLFYNTIINNMKSFDAGLETYVAHAKNSHTNRNFPPERSQSTNAFRKPVFFSYFEIHRSEKKNSLKIPVYSIFYITS